MMLKCHNCSGKGIFKSLECHLCRGKGVYYNKKCAHCKGLGHYDSDCPSCKGLKWLADEVEITFLNEDTNTLSSVVLNADTIKYHLAEENKAYQRGSKELAALDTYIIYLDQFLNETLDSIGASANTHFLKKNNQAWEGWITFSRTWTCAPIGASPQEIKRMLREAIAARFAIPIDIKFPSRPSISFTVCKRPLAEEMVKALDKKLEPHNLSYSISVHEGNIATGESGWAIYLLNSKSGQILDELSISYDLSISLYNALANVDESIERYLKKN